jgi:hypothetical protein
MRLRLVSYALVGVLAAGLAGCGGGEPSESQMKDAMNGFLNTPSPGQPAGDPINIASFKKGACDKPTPQGYNCTFTMSVTSTNMMAQMFNNLPSAVFYKDTSSGKWAMRAPF